MWLCKLTQRNIKPTFAVGKTTPSRLTPNEESDTLWWNIFKLMLNKKTAEINGEGAIFYMRAIDDLS